MKGDETALLVRTPDNQSLLLNAWTDGRSLAREAALRLPGTPRRMDAVVLTRSRRSGADSLGMLSSRIVVRRFIAWTDPPVEGNAVWEGASVDEEFSLEAALNWSLASVGIDSQKRAKGCLPFGMEEPAACGSQWGGDRGKLFENPDEPAAGFSPRA